jgi:iron donor protein CyaY
MSDELEFRRSAEAALQSLKRHLMAREQEDHDGFEVEEQDGVLNILFDDPAARFVITANAPMRQIWISALAASFKLNWDSKLEEFILPRTGETLAALVNRLISEYHPAGSSHL